jgi:hypothetical protein
LATAGPQRKLPAHQSRQQQVAHCAQFLVLRPEVVNLREDRLDNLVECVESRILVVQDSFRPAVAP